MRNNRLREVEENQPDNFLGYLLRKLWHPPKQVKSAVFLFLFFVCIFLLVAVKWIPRKRYVHKPTYFEITPNPKMMWYSDSLNWVPYQTIRCPNGSDTLECDVLPRTATADNVLAYLFYGKDFNISDVPLPRDSALWVLLHDQAPENNLELMHEKTLNLFNYSMTFSRYSDVPIPLTWLHSISDILDLIDYKDSEIKSAFLDKSHIAPVIYLENDCDKERDAYVQELMKYIPVDSYGTCLKNKKLFHDFVESEQPNRIHKAIFDEHECLDLISRYRFIITIDRVPCKDYVSDKVWRAIRVGTVPIYHGSPSIREWLPNNYSAIMIEDYPTPESLSNYLYKLLSNETQYEQHLEHKTKGIIENERLFFEAKYRPYEMHYVQSLYELECFVCEAMHSKKKDVRRVNKKHYDCQPPVSLLTLKPNVNSSWFNSFDQALERVNSFYRVVRENGSYVRNSTIM